MIRSRAFIAALAGIITSLIAAGSFLLFTLLRDSLGPTITALVVVSGLLVGFGIYAYDLITEPQPTKTEPVQLDLDAPE